MDSGYWNTLIIDFKDFCNMIYWYEAQVLASEARKCSWRHIKREGNHLKVISGDPTTYKYNPFIPTANTDTFANSVDPDETARNVSSWSTLFAILLLILTKPLFATMDESKFRDGRAHFRSSGMKELYIITYLTHSQSRISVHYLFHPRVSEVDSSIFKLYRTIVLKRSIS